MDLSRYFPLRDQLALDFSSVMRESRLVVPVSLLSKVIHLAHEGHQGIVRTKQRMCGYWWPGMDSMVNELLLSCTVCQLSDKTAKTYPAPMQPVDPPSGPFQKAAVDIVGPFERARYDCGFAITLVDYYSKWPEVASASSTTTEAITTFLSSVFAREGDPCSVVTDNGSQFCSTDFSVFLKERGIQHFRTSVYHAQANGAVECFNRVLKDCIRQAETQHQPWKKQVTAFLHHYRATPHATTNKTPFELLQGRLMLTIRNVLPILEKNEHHKTRQRIQMQQAKSKHYCDQKRGARVPMFKVGDLVRVRKPFTSQN